MSRFWGKKFEQISDKPTTLSKGKLDILFVGPRSLFPVITLFDLIYQLTFLFLLSLTVAPYFVSIMSCLVFSISVNVPTQLLESTFIFIP